MTQTQIKETVDPNQPPEPSKSGITIGNLMVSCLLTIVISTALTLFCVQWAMNTGKLGAKTEIMALDVDELLNTQMNVLLKSNMTKEQIGVESQLFSKRLNALLAKSAEEGRVIITKDALISMPMAVNVTPEFIKGLVTKVPTK